MAIAASVSYTGGGQEVAHTHSHICAHKVNNGPQLASCSPTAAAASALPFAKHLSPLIGPLVHWSPFERNWPFQVGISGAGMTDSGAKSLSLGFVALALARIAHQRLWKFLQIAIRSSSDQTARTCCFLYREESSTG